MGHQEQHYWESNLPTLKISTVNKQLKVISVNCMKLKGNFHKQKKPVNMNSKTREQYRPLQVKPNLIFSFVMQLLNCYMLSWIHMVLIFPSELQETMLLWKVISWRSYPWRHEQNQVNLGFVSNIHNLPSSKSKPKNNPHFKRNQCQPQLYRLPRTCH